MGARINKILKELNRKTIIFNLDYKKNEFKEYFSELKNLILENKIDIIWLAIPPKNHYKMCKFILECNTNIILEKPVILNLYQKKTINELLKKNKLFLSVHFEYLFLKKLFFFNKHLQFDSIEYIFTHSIKEKSHQPYWICIHLMSIKKLYFNNINNFKIKTALILKIKDK